jgi:hypothetical protein
MIQQFVDFAQREIACGGPEPELAPIVWLTQSASDIEKVWAAGVYCSHHCVSSAMIVYQQWRPNDVLDREHDFHAWLTQHWNALPVRNEMRSHRMVDKRLKCLQDFATYTLGESWRTGTYDDVWSDSIRRVKYFGRYVAIKYLEFLRRMVRPSLVLTDVRARSAWSVREGLGMLYPYAVPGLTNRADNGADTVAAVEALANRMLAQLDEDYHLRLSHFDLQVLLCEFKQWKNGSFYPGVSHDEEMEFATLVEQDFRVPEFWTARQILFPKSVLGEFGGWAKRRKELYG